MEVRDATADDHAAFARLMPELGTGDPIPSRQRFADELAARAVVAADGDDVVGYALFEVLAETGYVRNVVADPGHRRRGIGAALMEAMRQRFVAAGAARWCLNVRLDNVAAVALYRRCGLDVAYASAVLRLPAEAVVEVAPGHGLVVSEVAPADDVVVEDTLSLLRGQLASARAKAGRVLVQARRGDDVIGVAVYASSIPGAFPFRVREPAAAAVMIASLRTRLPAGAPWLQLGIEDDAALAARLRDAGATVRFEMVHMRGPLR